MLQGDIDTSQSVFIEAESVGCVNRAILRPDTVATRAPEYIEKLLARPREHRDKGEVALWLIDSRGAVHAAWLALRHVRKYSQKACECGHRLEIHTQSAVH